MTSATRRQLFLFEDRTAREWEPFSLTRPAGELLHGALLLRERLERAAGLSAMGVLGADELRGFEEDGAPPVISRKDLPAVGERLLLCSRYLPPLPGPDAGPSLPLPRPGSRDPLRLVARGVTVGWLLPPGAEPPDDARLARPDGEGASSDTRSSPDGPLASDNLVDLPGDVVDDPWMLVARNAARIAADLPRLFPGDSPGSGGSDEVRRLEPRPGVHVLGEHPVTVEADVRVDPAVVLDAEAGPIHLARGVRVRSHSRIEGPVYVGPGTVLLGGVIAASSVGPVCKVHGEVDSSVIVGYANKAHTGYLGHAVLGRWVNLGALTTNSDLKNTYGSVRVPLPGGAGERDTGRLKMGVLLGDHVRTGIGTLLNTGSVVGAGSNLFGGAVPPRWVPPFSWGTGERLQAYRRDRFLETARKVMARRDVALSAGMRDVLGRAWDRARGNDEPGTKPS